MRRERHPARLIALLLIFGTGCSGNEVVANYTGINLRAQWQRSLNLTTLPFRAEKEDGSEAFMPGEITVPASTATTAIQQTVYSIILRPDHVGEKVTLFVEGRTAGGELRVAGSSTATLELGHLSPLTILLLPPGTCGNGRMEGNESCDDGGELPGDGCDETCTVEQGWICVRSPSLCFTESITEVVTPATIAVATKRYLILRPGRYTTSLELDGVDRSLICEEGAELDPLTDQIAINVTNGAAVTIVGLKVRSAGILVEGSGTSVQLESMEIGPSETTGIVVRDGAALRVSRSRIEGNEAGGIYFDGGLFNLESTILRANGSPFSEIGGVRIASASGASELINATIAENSVRTSSTSTIGAGVHCEEQFLLVNDIIWGNSGGPPLSPLCTAAFSDVGPFAGEPGPLGMNSFSMDPKFSADLHLLPGSPCIDAGDDTPGFPTADIDGDPRPQGGGVDIGADEAQ